MPARLRELVEAWRDPSAWEGETEAGGAAAPAAQMGVVALDEIVLHGWDLAKATGQTFRVDPASAAAVLEFTQASARPENAAGREDLFGWWCRCPLTRRRSTGRSVSPAATRPGRRSGRRFLPAACRIRAGTFVARVGR